MNLVLKEVSKNNLEKIINNDAFWSHDFLIGTKHRFYCHTMNPAASEEDIVLILAYLNDRLVGYMGIFMDYINLSNKKTKIGWLSTWWLHKDSAGKGVGKQMLSRMYEIQNGKIGISQFTPSAKRVYTKSGYFNDLNTLHGCKLDIRLNSTYLLPSIIPSLSKILPLLKFLDSTFNLIISLRLQLARSVYHKKLNNYSIDYHSVIDNRISSFINENNGNPLCIRDKDFFEYLKAYHWIQESPLKNKIKRTYDYFFSDYNKKFNIYLVSVSNNQNKLVGFYCLLRKDFDLKVMQVYYLNEEVEIICNSILLHAIDLGVTTIITYDRLLSKKFKTSNLSKFRFKKKFRESIISKSFGDHDYSKYNFQYGDGDCSFA